ncbi:golgin subfamily A member 2-like [Heterocephalus glaber]|uniref:Golgin subfamily A member 2-like n=1 Tax=Heterocephalus glaber TaxID=10181 RepID=A0AAX6S9N3_HETGA|nr:golgin subfamily A member 2-like [Heterocephalus glaber]XP_021105144.1 golgin subfamily A member 2-like [Heterocephalus glaber]XP_021105145.1 golgin subfamily A member 2-like [Heterocephalus glaber]XP_021105146.1 golgin subfamily A member 2-like [Heterocephalus glaber]XP_021105148.1 golgin subfamily A member 2-like [Heterocephalus glaber]
MASALQSEQLERKELARKLGQLREKMVELTALMALKSQEAQQLQQQGEQLMSQVWQHAEAWQQLATEKKALSRRVLLHRQLVMQVQHTKQEETVALGRLCYELGETQVMKLLRRGPAWRAWLPLTSHFPGCPQEGLEASRLQDQESAPLRVLALAGAGWAEEGSETES